MYGIIKRIIGENFIQLSQSCQTLFLLLQGMNEIINSRIYFEFIVLVVVVAEFHQIILILQAIFLIEFKKTRKNRKFKGKNI